MKEEMLGNVQQNGEADLEMWTNISGILHKAANKNHLFLVCFLLFKKKKKERSVLNCIQCALVVYFKLKYDCFLTHLSTLKKSALYNNVK